MLVRSFEYALLVVQHTVLPNIVQHIILHQLSFINWYMSGTVHLLDDVLDSL